MIHATASGLLELPAVRQAEHAAGRSRASQKERGQFFTPPSVAAFMASMVSDVPAFVRILDPGAGGGILAAAVCERISRLTAPREVEVHAYEVDRAVLPVLNATLEESGRLLESRGHSLKYFVHQRDFVLDGPGSVQDGLFAGEQFDITILNPPYLKISKSSPYANSVADLVYGQPNLYAIFMALAAQCLGPGGQFVAITPRSFCNGPYFSAFREWFTSRMSMHRFHLFRSRTDAFAEASVLQENVITYARRERVQSPMIRLTHSEGRDTDKMLPCMKLDAGFVIAGKKRIIRLPASETEAAVMHEVESWPQRFDALGLRVSTGPVVMFRAAEFVRRGEGGKRHIPLLSSSNVHAFRTIWPAKTANKTLVFEDTPASRKLLVPARNYVLTRRFSPKEEMRRLVASPLLASDFGGVRFAIENHLNYVYHARRELSHDETMGITAMLNSRLLDVYFRTISGNTQVNAAEIRAMPFPQLTTLASIGRTITKAGITDPVEADAIVVDTLGINGIF